MVLGAIIIGAIVGYSAAILLYVFGSPLIMCVVAVPVIGGVTMLAVAVRAYLGRSPEEGPETGAAAEPLELPTAREEAKPEYA
ncbi:MAG: hypothetical protein KGI94_03145 [Paracoccaceae bacterium]|nr:hypothetical protein [Paracoccaceae bacterium]MDE3123706.1 hypothetical protein [Paracoccaceae bacterium]